MTEHSTTAPSPRKGEQKKSAFDIPRTDGKHIIDVMIEERCPSFVNHWTWPVVRPLLYRALGYKRAVKTADKLIQLSGEDSFDFLAAELDFALQVNNLEHVPESGRCVIVANHPTGLADGAAVWKALRARRKDIIFFANADAMRINPRFGEVTIPVEWVLEKRTPAKTRETLKLAGEAFTQEMCVVIFPSGKLAKMVNGKFTEQEWFPTAISLARKKNAPIIPLHVDARNSSLFYFVSKFSGELRDITLFRELLNKKGSHFGMHFGPSLIPEKLTGDANEITERLKNHVAYAMADDPHRTFLP